MPLREHLIEPPDKALLLVVELEPMSAQIARTKDKVVVHPVDDLLAERRIHNPVVGWDRETHFTAVNMARGSPIDRCGRSKAGRCCAFGASSVRFNCFTSN